MNARKCWQWGAILLILALALAGCGRKAPEQLSAGPAGPGGGVAAMPPGGPGGAGGPGGPGGGGAMGPGGGGGSGMSSQWEEAQKKYPGTMALFRAVGGLRDLQEDGKEPLSSAQAKAVVPILQSLKSKEKLTQEEAKKVADRINGYLTPTQQEIIGAGNWEIRKLGNWETGA